MSKPQWILTHPNRDIPVGEKEPVGTVARTDVLAALNDFLELVGTSAAAVVDGSLYVDGFEVRFESIEPIAGVEPQGKPTSDPRFNTLVWPVTVKVVS